MSFTEILLVLIMAVLAGAPIWVAYRSKDRTLFWNPLTLIAAVFAYYFLIGPLVSLSLHNTFAYGMDLRDMMTKAWLAGVLGLGSIYAGFAIKARPYRARFVKTMGAPLRRRLWMAFAIFTGFALLGLAYNIYMSGQSLAQVFLPLHEGSVEVSEVERQGMAAGNYVFLLINVFIPAFCLLTVLTAGRPTVQRWLIVGAPVLVVVLFYISIAFRHRIVVMMLSLAATACLLRGKRPSPLGLLGGAAGIVLLSGFIVLTRSYGRGLDLSQVKDLSVMEIFLGGFSDAGTFFTTGLVVDSIPATFPYVGLEPLWIALTIPIPRSIWPEKPYASFLQYFESLTGTQGQAVPVTGEHYMMGGWIGIVIGGVIIGLIYRRFWEFYRANPDNPLVIAMYAVAWALVFPVINRGYLAQTLMEFFFDLLPLVVVFLFSRKIMLAGARRRVRRTPAANPDGLPAAAEAR